MLRIRADSSRPFSSCMVMLKRFSRLMMRQGTGFVSVMSEVGFFIVLSFLQFFCCVVSVGVEKVDCYMFSLMN